MNELIAALFDLQGWIVYRFTVSKTQVDIVVGRPRKEAPCPHCGACTTQVHGRAKGRRAKLHSWCDGRPVVLWVRPRRFWCGGCRRAFTERLPDLAPWARRTGHAERALLGALAERSFRGTARQTGTSPGILRRALVRRVSATVDLRTALADLPAIVLGIDEHSFRGTDLMVTVTCVWPARRLLAILPNDRVGTLERFLRGLPAEIRPRIRAVCIDLKASWRKALQRELPQVPVVADRFHVMRTPTGGWIRRGSSSSRWCGKRSRTGHW